MSYRAYIDLYRDFPYKSIALPKTNIFALENRPKPRRKVIHQPSIFRGYVSFLGVTNGGVMVMNPTVEFVKHHLKQKKHVGVEVPRTQMTNILEDSTYKIETVDRK